jgi:hypothetical protein
MQVRYSFGRGGGKTFARGVGFALGESRRGFARLKTQVRALARTWGTPTGM